MEISRFWEIVEAARGAQGPFHKALFEQLVQLPADEILAFDGRFDQLQRDLYRWDVWGAAYVIGGGCSDDAFIDFRAGMISFGREWYERVLQQPESLAEHPLVQANGGDQFGDLFYEEVNYVAADAYRQVTGHEHIPKTAVLDERGMGQSFDIDDEGEVQRRYPRLASICR